MDYFDVLFAKKQSGGGGTPTLITKTITANGTYIASEDNADGYSQVTVNVPYMEKKSASGDIASFSDGAGYPFLKVKANITPVQDLHGYDYPWVGGANLNLLRPGEAKTYTSNGITFTSDGSGKYTIKGTATANVNCTFDCEEYTTPDGSNTTLMFMNTATNPNVAFEFHRDTTLVDNWALSVTNRIQYPFTALSQKTINKYNIFVAVDSTVDMTISPMFITGDVTANPPSFRPYSNICPISGFTGVNVTVSPTTTEGSGTVYPISWQDEAGIVYGGYIDLVSGVLTVTKVGIAEYNGETLPSAWISDRDRYVVGNTPTIGAQVVYDLATPQTYQLTPQQINTLIGQNNVWNNTNGQTEVEYFIPIE